MPNTYQNCIAAALADLSQARSLLSAEISDYPTPISGCDAQFNRLLSDRTRISEAILSLESRPFVATPRMMDPGERVESR